MYINYFNKIIEDIVAEWLRRLTRIRFEIDLKSISFASRGSSPLDVGKTLFFGRIFPVIFGLDKARYYVR